MYPTGQRLWPLLPNVSCVSRFNNKYFLITCYCFCRLPTTTHCAIMNFFIIYLIYFFWRGETYNIAKWVHNNTNSNRKQCLFATCLERMLLFSWLLNISWRFCCHWSSWRWWWRRRRWFIRSYPFSATFYTILIICLFVCPSVRLSVFPYLC